MPGFRDLRDEKYAGRTDGQSVSASDQSIIVSGVDGSGNARMVSTDTDGVVQVAITSGSTAATEYTEDDIS